MTVRFILSSFLIFSTACKITCKYNPLFQAEASKKTKTVKVKPEHPCPGKLIKNMDEAELQLMLPYAKQINDHELVFKTFFHLISQSKSPEAIKTYKLDYADYAFELQDYEKALAAYDDYCMLYPGSDQAEYATYKTILCVFFLSLDFDRDQTTTQRTISVSQLFLQKAKNEKFITEIQNIYKTCRRRLFDHEVYVLQTYLKQFKFSGAAKRLEYIQKEFEDIEHLQEYVVYIQSMIETIKDPKTRPFIIQLNLQHALNKKEEKQHATSTLRRAMSFFLA